MNKKSHPCGWLFLSRSISGGRGAAGEVPDGNGAAAGEVPDGNDAAAGEAVLRSPDAAAGEAVLRSPDAAAGEAAVPQLLPERAYCR